MKISQQIVPLSYLALTLHCVLHFQQKHFHVPYISLMFLISTSPFSCLILAGCCIHYVKVETIVSALCPLLPGQNKFIFTR